MSAMSKTQTELQVETRSEQSGIGLLRTTVRLVPREPYSFAQSLRFLRAFRPMEGEQILGHDRLAKAIRAGGDTWVYVVGESPSGGLDLELYGEQPITADAQAKIVERVRFFLSLDDDLDPFYAEGIKDEPMKPVLRSLFGMHQVKMPSPFEATCWAILGQRAPVPQARQLKHRLTEAYGGTATLGEERLHAFPEPADLALASEDDLVALLKNKVKGWRIRAAADAFMRVDEAFLKRGPIQDVELWLRSIDGIGPWSCAFVLLRGLGRGERIRGAEEQILPAVQAIYGRDLVHGAADVRRLAERYGSYQGYWALYTRFGSALLD